MTTLRAQTSHIQACRRAWHEHYYSCTKCALGIISTCEQGRVFYDEYVAAITANRECEHLNGTEATCDPTTTP